MQNNTMTLSKQISLFTEENATFLQADFLVSHSQLQEKEKVQKTTFHFNQEHSIHFLYQNFKHYGT